MSSLTKLKESILADGVIDEQEVKQLRELIFEDGKIDDEEAEFLFELNDAVSGNSNHESWQTLFVEAIASFLLEDETSPGVVEEEEAKWLLVKIEDNGKIDDVEKALLLYIKKKAKKISPLLNKLIKQI